MAAASQSAVQRGFPISPFDLSFDFSGETLHLVERVSAISAEQARAMLVEVRSETGWSRPTLAALLGVSLHSLRKWETGKRRPSGAARRLIWLVAMMALHPERSGNGMDLVTWGEK